MLKKALQFLLFLCIGIVILTLVFRSQNAAFQEQCRLDGVPPGQCSLTDKLFADFSTVHIGWILAVAAAFTVSNIFRALRWQMLMTPLGYRAGFGNSMLTILLGYFANLGFPRMGARRELKFALESYWRGESSRAAATARLRTLLGTGQ